MLRADAAAQIIGEMVIYLPMVILAALLRVAPAVVVAMLIFFAGKWWYPSPIFHFNRAWMCVVASYGVFITIGMAYRILGAVAPWGAAQPMSLVLGTVGLTWMYAWAGLRSSRK